MNEIIFIIEEAPEGGYTAKALGVGIFTEAETMKELKEMVKDAIRCHFEADEMPNIVRLHFVKDEIFNMAS
ncbi:MAG: 2-oxoisovalerate dehydrogenase [Bacteroidota bacterium]|nr:2-oxoisovalerate dehydrogenase [Bacteroidota bacterium]